MMKTQNVKILSTQFRTKKKNIHETREQCDSNSIHDVQEDSNPVQNVLDVELLINFDTSDSNVLKFIFSKKMSSYFSHFSKLGKIKPVMSDSTFTVFVFINLKTSVEIVRIIPPWWYFLKDSPDATEERKCTLLMFDSKA